MAQILSTEIVTRHSQTYAVFTVPSTSNPNKSYRVDVTNGRCDCPAWKFKRASEDGKRTPCKHLRQFGYTEDTKVITPAKATDYAKAL